MNDEGAATLSTLALAAGLTVVGAAALGLAGTLITQRALQNSTDLAALAAADTLVGVRAGQPCDSARTLLGFRGAQLQECVVEMSSVTLVATRDCLPTQCRATARAGVIDSGGT